MKMTLRFVLPLLVALGVIAYGVSPVIEALTLHWFTRDIELRSQLIVNTIQDSLVPLLDAKENKKVIAVLTKVTQDDRLMAIGYCDPAGNLVFKTQHYPKEVTCASVQYEVTDKGRQRGLAGGDVFVTSYSVDTGRKDLGSVVLVHDMSYVQRRSSDTRKYVFLFFVALGLIISALTVLIAQLSWRGWVSSLRTFLRGGEFQSKGRSHSPELTPIIKEFRTIIRQLESNQRIRDESLLSWTPKTLKTILERELAGQEILVVSNREPYIHHQKDDGSTEVRYPASGLVTALEPVMRACSGTWIAHGSGNADKDNSDKLDHVPVPPENPKYTLRRVWLTPEEEQGYYYGFSNEGMWPLCHIAHTRPVFKSSDWKQYKAVNEKFAEAVVREAKTSDPVVLVQDYHFALLPKMIRERLPNATIITFWHIPWPNPEAFGICPWREEILEGMLGSNIIGFHIQFHCNNFIETVDRFLESRIDREHSTISLGGKLTAINPYPISIEWNPQWLSMQAPVPDCRKAIREKNGLAEDVMIGLGVDRMDYTKGILERFLAVEHLLQTQPRWVGKFSFIQIAAPSRSSIETYKRFQIDVRALTDRINARFGKEGYRPIVLLTEHHEPPEVFQYYRGADICFVGSLHDGMNLVAKEFIAARDDESGALILSLFAGASRELPEALIVNPYDVEQCADALRVALQMPEAEKKERMRSMRGLVQEYNVYRWAGRKLIDAARIKQRSRLLHKMASVRNWQHDGREGGVL
jgi:trehalose-6-phosphate synthase